MNPIRTSRTAEHGTALLVALFLSMILSVTIAGYLKHARQQHYISMRSQVWNTSIAVSEAGVEEALQHLNSNSSNLTENGWSQSGTIYTMSRTLNDSARYTVTIDAANMRKPVIVSQAYLNATTYAMVNEVPMFATANVTVSTANSQMVSRAVRVTAGRAGLFLKAMVAKHTIDMNGNNVLTDSFDSTDPDHSNNGKYPAGNWSKLLDNGDVASNDNIINVISVGNANIYGHVAVGPGGTISVGSQGGVGSHLWQAFNNGIQSGWFTDDMNFTFPTITLPYTTGLTPQQNVTLSTTNYTIIGSTNATTSATYPSPVPEGGVQTNISYTTSATLPSPVPYGTVTNTLTTSTTSSTYPAAGTYVGTVTKQGSKWKYNRITGYNYTYPTYTYTYLNATYSTNFSVASKTYDYLIVGGAANLPPVDYYVDSISSGNILVKGNARLVVRNNFSLGGNGSKNALTIDTDGKLQMYVGGTSVSLSGNGVINKTGYAQDFILWCTDSVTSLSLNGNGEFTGVLVAPNADVRLNGGGSADEDFIGSLLANTIVLNGHYSFHYDEALQNYNGAGRYIITQWDEVPIAQSGL
jgi:hypothetical protein